jgi:hypothetical protein
MIRLSVSLAEKFMRGEYENDPGKTARQIEELKNSYPSFETLSEMLSSEPGSAKEAALYVLYNKSGALPDDIRNKLRQLTSHSNDEIRLWAQANLEE